MAEKQRTLRQNKALHLYFTLLALELNKAGLDMKKVLKPEIDIPWTTESIKEHIWRPIQKAMTIKKSTTELERGEVTKIYETINRFMGEKHGVSVTFPSEEEISLLKDMKYI